MNVVLYTAVSVDGYISTIDNKTPWSDEEWTGFKKIVSMFGNIIIGRKTYQIMKCNNEFENIGNPLTIVLTTDKNLIDDSSKILFVDTPQKALDILSEKGFETAIIAGGQKVNSSFLKAGLINEIYADIEPVILGSGISIFNVDDESIRLKLLWVNKYGESGVQLHYNVLDSLSKL